ncbi:class II lanthipeptide, LchA2/BrtA2 family [Priestia filamentosa]|jgi:Type-A lantibiotic|uniref:class II lanthipeptide, LchA2/BrtA2 family n=1 Tax=Priestia TaxID=2800373 RepID=UPI0009ECFFF5|nr:MULTISPECIES: class II lanthipeptide, LchA2/BrtA2 family [Priestia]KAB2496357.1 type A2 lantipeptide [Priestia endophytica]KAB2496358.1 type A2 lantipeptide [Priestia endophytica]MCM3536687.1 class II lanthipeptide, LchA2/BrtA2 family [Priestia endophytica]MCM3536688.1 class II lanthipeptide, LchA2/BrtA2 family [Priestia endophytica]MED4072939.1 class II lanthipeptide, LchA2/BrtA2 family [Priestia endophytica]
MKKNMKAIEEVSEQELKELAGGAEERAIWTVTIPISLAACPTTQCASIVSPCND